MFCNFKEMKMLKSVLHDRTTRSFDQNWKPPFPAQNMRPRCSEKRESYEHGYYILLNTRSFKIQSRFWTVLPENNTLHVQVQSELCNGLTMKARSLDTFDTYGKRVTNRELAPDWTSKSFSWQWCALNILPNKSLSKFHPVLHICSSIFVSSLLHFLFPISFQ